RCLFVASRRAPHLSASWPSLHTLPDDELAAFLKKMGGPNVALVDEPRYRQVFFSKLRSDLRMSDFYAYTPEEPLACPIHGFLGIADQTVTRVEMEAWKEHTSMFFQPYFLGGGHAFDEDGQLNLLRTVSLVLRDHFIG